MPSEVAFEHVVRAIRAKDGDHVRASEALQHRNAPTLIDPPDNATEAQIEATAAAMRAQHAEHAQKLASIDQQIVQKRTEGEEAKASLAKLRASLPLVAQEAEVHRQVMEMQWGNKIAWLQAQRRLVEQQHEPTVIEHKREEADAARAALERRREQIRAEYEKTILTDLAKAEQQASQSGQELVKAAQKAQLQTLRAPIDGTVQQLAMHTLGGVVTPAQPVLMVVPDNVALVVEARVENKDVGFIRSGQDAEVKVESFNFTRYGLIHGTVLGISRDTVGEDQRALSKASDGKNEDNNRSQQGSGAPGYTARIAIDRTAIDTENGPVNLGPGMTVTAEIKTGKRRVMDYLLSPLVRYRHEGLRER